MASAGWSSSLGHELGSRATGRAIERNANWLIPDLPPPPELIIESYWTGAINWDRLQYLLRVHGINLNTGGPADISKFAEPWLRGVHASQEVPDNETARRWAARHWITQADLEWIYRLNGYAPRGLPQRDRIVAAQARQTEPLSVGDIFRAWNRLTIPDSRAFELLRYAGYNDPHDRADLANLRFEVPGPADLVRFAVRHVFEPDLLQSLGYDAEYQPILDIFHQAHGVNYPIFSGPLAETVDGLAKETGLTQAAIRQRYQSAGIPEPTWARAYWWSHWVLPSAGQGYTMFQRLRRTRSTGAARDPSGEIVDRATLNLLLRANDYPPFWREKLTAIAYHPVTRVDLRRLWRDGAISQREDLYEGYRDLGYNERDADLLTDWTVNETARIKRGRDNTALRTQVIRGYRVGTLDRDQARASLTQLGETPAAIDQLLLAADLDGLARLADKTISAMRACYLRAECSDTQVLTQLQLAGINELRAGQYLDSWKLDRVRKGRHLTLAQIFRLYREGVLMRDQLRQRIANLGYDARDTEALVEMGDQDVALARARAAEQLARTSRQKRAALLREARETRQRQKEIGRRLAGYGTPDRWAKWVCLGFLSEADYYVRTTNVGISRTDAERNLAAALTKCRTARPSQGLGQSPAPVPVSGL